MQRFFNMEKAMQFVNNHEFSEEMENGSGFTFCVAPLDSIRLLAPRAALGGGSTWYYATY